MAGRNRYAHRWALLLGVCAILTGLPMVTFGCAGDPPTQVAERSAELPRRLPAAAPILPAPAVSPSPSSRPSQAAQRPSASPRPGTSQGGVNVARAQTGWSSWALLDRRTGAIRSGGDAGTNSTESMIKAWIAADYLAGLAGREPTGTETDQMRRMIRDSDDRAAQQLYRARGSDAVVRRLMSTCGLTNTKLYSAWWSLTEMSAPDAARMGDCIADGRVTDPHWTGWLLDEMRQVRGEGRFGVVQVRPTDQGQPIAIKNGWTYWNNGTWHVNCLAVADGWSLAVLTRYPGGLGLEHGAGICRTVTRQVLGG